MHIVVFGSINMDLVIRIPRFPNLGETLSGYSLRFVPGGKGANQAMACMHLGIPTIMVGRIGEDAFGKELLLNLKDAGFDLEYIHIDSSAASGAAVIMVDKHATNRIIVFSGANGQIDQTDIYRLETALKNASILLLQLEVPVPLVITAIKMATQRGIKVILDPAPAQKLPKWVYTHINILTPNLIEASHLAGFSITSKADMTRAANIFLSWGVKHIIIKMGEQGVYYATSKQQFFYPSIPVEALDTVGAGDAFNGALAVSLHEGNSIENAIRWGLAAGALAVTKEGAQTAMPNRVDLQKLLMR